VSQDFLPFFEEQIEIQQGAIISFKRWMIALVLLGLIIILGVLIFRETLGSTSSPIVGTGGALIGTLSAFPYREITPRRSRISAYSALVKLFEKFQELPGEEQQTLNELALDTLKKNL
jgi:hypothetical protein